MESGVPVGVLSARQMRDSCCTMCVGGMRLLCHTDHWLLRKGRGSLAYSKKIDVFVHDQASAYAQARTRSCREKVCSGFSNSNSDA